MTDALHLGDCLDVLPTLPAGSVHACIERDPEYHAQAVRATLIPKDAVPQPWHG